MSATRSVLVVDDDEQLLRLIVRLLERGVHLPEPLEQALAAKGGRFLRKPFAPKSLLRLFSEREVPQGEVVEREDAATIGDRMLSGIGPSRATGR